jgi:hypothetical protein
MAVAGKNSAKFWHEFLVTLSMWNYIMLSFFPGNPGIFDAFVFSVPVTIHTLQIYDILDK